MRSKCDISPGNNLSIKKSADSGLKGMQGMVKHVQEARKRGSPKEYATVLPPPFINRMTFEALHNQCESVNSNPSRGTNPNKEMIRSHTTMRASIQHGPAPPILSLRSTTIREVAERVNHIHKDRILFVKTIHDAHRIVGTNSLVEDEHGDCLMVSIYNFVPPNEDPADIFPKGTHMALLAPYMKNSCDDPKRNLLLRCDNPDCVRIFSSYRSWYAAKRGKKLVDTQGLDPKKLRKEGNEAFLAERFETAARCYSRAVECLDVISQDDKIACLGNLAEVRLRQEQWEAAEAMARAVLELEPTNTKARYRLASAQIRLNKVEEASHVIETQEARSFRRLQRDLKQLLIEKTHGIYNLAKIRQEAASRPGEALRTFHANFLSKKIKQGVDIARREDFTYRGSIALEDIPTNTMIASSKALVFVPAGRQNALNFSIDPYTKKMQNGSSMALEEELVRLMHQRPLMRKSIYSLASGLEESTVSRTDERIDLRRIQCIVSSNTFAVETTDDVAETWAQFKEQSRDAFPHEEEVKTNAAAMRKMLMGSGLWIQESLFNHSCTPNSTWRQIGDQMFVYTTKPVKAGDELTVSYVEPNLSFSEREERFKGWIQPGLGFECQCDWCHSIRSCTELRKLEKRVHEAYKRAAFMVSFRRIKMAVASEQAMSSYERKAAIAVFSRHPSALQHKAGAHLWIMQGTCEAHAGNMKAALEAYEKAAEIMAVVRGHTSIERAKDLWRIVGASMACGDRSRALQLLHGIYKDVFAMSSLNNDTEEVFRELTLHYSLPWWSDDFAEQRLYALHDMIDRVFMEIK